MFVTLRIKGNYDHLASVILDQLFMVLDGRSNRLPQ